MARKREQSLLDDLFDLLKRTPFWIGPLLAVAAFAFLRFLIPLLLPSKPTGLDFGSILRPMLPMFSWLTGGMILIVWVAAEIYKLSNRKLLNSQSGIESIGNISWDDFERLVAEAYRRKGFIAEVVGNASGDDGVDIRLTRSGEMILVQCKQWKAWKVGVTTIRELLGVVVSERATGGILVTSGRFTQEARDFAQRNKQIELVDGPALEDLIGDVQRSDTTAHMAEPPAALMTFTPPRCPSCGSDMVLRTARKGRSIGSQFWGCQNYPNCRGTRPC